MANITRPRARSNDLLVQDAQNELVIYDTRTDKAYVLNPSAAAVWRACNGKRSVQEIAQYLNQTTPTDEQAVYYALAQLDDLLEQPTRNGFTGMSRRQFLKRAGVVATAAAIPVVVKIVAPKPAHAQSFTEFCCVCNNTPTSGALVLDCAVCNGLCATLGGVASCVEGGAACEA
jgi:hypothetical protein